MSSRDLYNDLGVNKTADKKTIKRAYRSKARKVHPDITGGDVDQFHRIQIAYDVLMDDAKRQRYDQTGLFNRKREDSEEAAIMLIQAIMAYVDNPIIPDFIARGVQQLKSNREELMREIQQYQSKAVIYREKATRVKRKSEGDNLIESALLQQAEQSEKIVQNGNERLIVIDKAIALGEDYKLERGKESAAIHITMTPSRADNNFSIWGATY